MFTFKALAITAALASAVIALPTTPSTSSRYLHTLVTRTVKQLPVQGATCPDSRDGKNQDTDTYDFNDLEIENAIQKGGIQSNPGTSDPNPGGYSHEFRNDEKLKLAAGCDSNLYEWPILPGGGIYGGGQPGPFRAIFKPDPDFNSRNALYCGLAYHPRNSDGSESTSFKSCTDVN